MTHNPVYVTGCNAPYFPILLPFLDSFSGFCNGEKLYVCDFGLSLPQQNFLSEMGLILHRPPDLAQGLHSYYYKASIGRYLEKVDFDTVIWIDCDCLILDQLRSHVSGIMELLEGDGEYVAVCPDYSGSVEDFIQRHQNDNAGTLPFRHLMSDAGLTTELQYLNSAVFILRCGKFLSEWSDLAFSVDYHVLFEQNVFNYLAYKGPQHLHLLDTDIWNVHDLSLNRLTLSNGRNDSENGVYINGKRAFIAHATSFAQRAIAVKNVSFDNDGRKLQGLFKFILNPGIQKLQVEHLMNFIKNHKGLLLSTGVFEASA